LLTLCVDLARQVAEDLINVLERAGLPFDVIQEPWKMFVLYYASRIYGAFGGTISLRVHGFDREASLLERALYEYYTKMMYYTIFKSDAQDAVRSYPKQYQQLLDKLKFEKSRFMSEEQMVLAEAAFDYNLDAHFKNMRDKLVREPRFTRCAAKPAIKFYLTEPRGRWNIYWVATSQVVHGSLMDVLAASKLDLEKREITGELDSRRPQPNVAMLMACDFAIYTALHLESEFGLTESVDRSNIIQQVTLADRVASSMDDFVDGGSVNQEPDPSTES